MRPLILLALAGVLAAGCTPLRSHQGYIVDADLVNAIQPGVDNRQSVLATLGTPSFAGQFNQGDWYYIARDSRNYAFNTPKAREQLTLQISFDRAGNVSAVRKSGVEQVVNLAPYRKTTPTLGRERGFFQDLFGNIGTVGAAGAGGSAGPTGRNGQ
ncbi:MAG: outer membrane protein assembly factor BamE [Sphingomonas taxi]|uniref:Outer membrane protein assembly factor BamE n=1 Tax=Sphingomonas taxi TaxID=1549858 RepID=A0A2W5RFE1_9SPHN|nr:MAG: outer membrane protein assembly factor BamE [Sphingomonas taxi]